MVSHTPFHHSLVFGTHLAKVVAVDLLPITDHIKDQMVVEADEDTSFFTSFVFLPSRTNKRGVSDSTAINYSWTVEKVHVGSVYIQ